MFIKISVCFRNYFSSKLLNVSILSSRKFSINFSSSFDAEKRFWRVLNSFNIFFASVGPIPGKPSRINCFCSSNDFIFFVGLTESSVFGLSDFLASKIRNFAVSSSSCVKIIGTLKSKIVERNIPRVAFS